MPSHKRTTAADVAARAGVSISTVSKAMSGRGAVHPETRDRVIEAARELNFRASQIAASLHSGRTGTIGVVTSDRVGRLSVPVLLGAIESLAEHDMALLLSDGRGDPIREQYFIDSLLRRRVDGILVTGSGSFSRAPLRGASGVPVVYAMAWSTDPDDVSIVADDAGGAALAARHLVATGRRRLACVTGPSRDDAARIRVEATADALGSAELELVTEPLFGRWDESWGRQATHQLVHAGLDFDGVICGNDWIARGVVAALGEHGHSVPGDVGVIGFDNWDVMVEGSRPHLSTIDMSLTEIGKEAATRLADLISHGTRRPGRHRVEAHLIPRESTARMSGRDAP